jgi:hypothetical protein
LGASELSSLIRRSGALLLVAVALFSAFTFWSATTLQIIKAEPTTGTGDLVSIKYEYVELSYLASHPQEFKGFSEISARAQKYASAHKLLWLSHLEQNGKRGTI